MDVGSPAESAPSRLKDRSRAAWENPKTTFESKFGGVIGRGVAGTQIGREVRVGGTSGRASAFRIKSRTAGVAQSFGRKPFPAQTHKPSNKVLIKTHKPSNKVADQAGCAEIAEPVAHLLWASDF